MTRPPHRLLVALLLAPTSTFAAAAPLPAPLTLHLDSAGTNPTLDAARELYTEGRYAEAASAFERIYRTTGNTAALFNAGMAREAAGAGHETHAVFDWLRYLELTPAASEEERLDLQRKITTAQAHTTPVELHYEAAPDGPEPTRIELYFTSFAPTAADPLTFQALPDPYSKTPVIRAHLALGEWSARTYSGAKLLHQQPFSLTEQSDTPQLIPIAPPQAKPQTTAQPQPRAPHKPQPIDPPHQDPTPKKEPRLRLALTLTTGLASAALLGAGLGLRHTGLESFKKNSPGLDNLPVLPLPEGQERVDQIDRLIADTRTTWTGISLLGAGIGAGIVAIGEATVPRRYLRPMHIAELAFGGTLTVTNAILIPVYQQRDRPWNSDTTTDLLARQDKYRLGYAFLGVAAGMTTAALLASITRHLIDRQPKGRSPRVSLQGAVLHF